MSTSESTPEGRPPRAGGARADATDVRNELSGTVVGPSVQAHTIHGGVHVHQAAHGSTVPRQLLATPAHFVNRRAEIAELDDLLDRHRATLALLSGPGGVGKTALAMHWGNRVKDRFADGHLYVDLGGFSGGIPTDPGAALTAFLHALGVPPERIPPALAEQAALYRSVTAGRSLLVLLDNAYSAAQVRPMVPASASSMTVVTSRSRLIGLIPDGARTVEVGPLDLDDSVGLVTRMVGAGRIVRERERTEELAGICAGLPIALCIVAARLAGRPHLSIERVTTDLTNEAHRLDALSTPEGVSVRAAFDVSYRFLDGPTAALYRRLALHPGPEFGAGPVTALLPTIGPGQPAGARADAVEPLLLASLLHEVTAGRYRFHDLVRLHGRHKAEVDETRSDREHATRAMLEWYLAAATRAGDVVTPGRRRLPYAPVTGPVELPTLPGRTEALAWLDQERHNLLSACRAALDCGYAELAWQISDSLWPLYLYRKYYRDRMAADQYGVEAARIWGNAWAEGRMLWRLGRVYININDYDAAERCARAAMVRHHGADDVRDYVEAQELLASVYRVTGREVAAAELLTETLAVNRGLAVARWIGLTLISLGTLLPGVGRPYEGIGLLEEARDLFADLSEVDPYNQTRVLVGLAAVYLDVGDLDNAEAAATEAAQRMHDLGSEHEMAEALDLLGRVADRRGRPETAGQHYRRAVEVFDRLGSSRAAAVRERLAQAFRSADPVD